MSNRSRGGQPGNNNAAKGKDWQSALKYALDNYSEGKVARGQALREIAKAVIVKALEGDMIAVKEIGDRLDGKPHVSADVTGTGWTVVIKGDDASL